MMENEKEENEWREDMKLRGVSKEDLAYQWCRLNDVESFYHTSWSKEEIYGGLKVLERFVDKRTIHTMWKKYLKNKNLDFFPKATLKERIRREMTI